MRTRRCLPCASHSPGGMANGGGGSPNGGGRPNGGAPTATGANVDREPGLGGGTPLGGSCRSGVSLLAVLVGGALLLAVGVALP